MKCLKQYSYIRYVIAKLSKFVQISMLASSVPFYRVFFEDWKGPGTSFHATFSIVFFDKSCLVMLHKMAKFNYHAVSASQVIQQNMFHVLSLDTWWRHEIWISESRLYWIKAPIKCCLRHHSCWFTSQKHQGLCFTVKIQFQISVLFFQDGSFNRGLKRKG